MNPNLQPINSQITNQLSQSISTQIPISQPALQALDPLTYQPTQTQTQQQTDKTKKKKKRETNNEEVEEMAQALYIYWKSRDIVKNGECDYEEANERAEIMWKSEENEKILDDFRKAAAVQIVMLGGEYIGNKPKRHVRSEFGKNRAECNPFLLFCRDHRENVREKGSRGKGMITLSSMWKDLSFEEKNRYIEKAKLNKAKDSAMQNKEGQMEQINQFEMETMNGQQEEQIHQMPSIPLDVVEMNGDFLPNL